MMVKDCSGFFISSLRKLVFLFFFLSSFFFFLFCFSGLYPRHIDIPRLGVGLELRLLAYTTITAIHDPSHVCNLHHSSRQCQIFNPLSEARDRTCNLIVPSRIHFHWATMGTPDTTFWSRIWSYFINGETGSKRGTASKWQRWYLRIGRSVDLS